jgi:calcineurin-like phosphoesterase family protein
MADIWVISDTHFNHANILKFERGDGTKVRNFDSVDHMNQTMIDNWNSVVKPGDKVYHLGDVFFGNKDDFKKLWPKLNGSKRLIFGNHDDATWLSSGGFFQKTAMWRVFGDWGLLFTHVPVHPSTLTESRFDGKPMLNVHGHIHANPSPQGPYKCVCVEQTNFTLVHIEELIQCRERM